MKRISNNYRNGIFLGYPECCIKAFGDVAVFASQRPLLVRQQMFNGFIPCPDHAIGLEYNPESKEDFIAHINENRKCSVPFKQEHTREEQETIDKEIHLMNLTNWLNS